MTPNLTRNLFQLFGWHLLLLLVLAMLVKLSIIGATFLIKFYVDSLSGGGSGCLGLFLVIKEQLLLTWLSRHLLNFYMYEVATPMRKALTGLLYAKALRLSVASLSQITPGKLINIFSETWR